MKKHYLISETLYYIDAKFACGGMIVKNNIVAECAPVFKKWLSGKTIKEAIDIIKKNKWSYKVLTR
jgi:hypothetical protein